MLLLALQVAACGARSDLGAIAPRDASAPDAPAHDAPAHDAEAVDSGAVAFPLGTYTDCAQGLHNPDGNIFMNSTGFEPGATLTLEQSGATLGASYVDLGGTTSSFDFAATSATSATLAHAAQVSSGFKALCVLGVGVSNEQMYPAVLHASAGALTYDSGSVFLSVAGQLKADTGTCGPQAIPAGFWIVCRQGPAAQPVDAGPPPSVPSLPVGSYACSSQVETRYQSGGQTQIVSGGSSGTLVLSQSGAQLTASYSGDPSVAGTLQLGVTTASTANALATQSLTVPCDVPLGTGGAPPPPKPEQLPIAAASLAVDGPTLFLSFSGALGAGSSCSGAEKVGSVICSLQ